jgi:hypothetical protein
MAAFWRPEHALCAHITCGKGKKKKQAQHAQAEVVKIDASQESPEKKGHRRVCEEIVQQKNTCAQQAGAD